MLFGGTEPVCLIAHSRTSPSFNLAAEEHFLRGRRENFIMLWRNEPSIIIGRNQNAYAELDINFVRENGVTVIRRLTGGGAVFHDLGNINFTFIKNGQDGMADFKEYLEPVVGYLRLIGLDAEFSGRNDILVGGMKVSGSAQTNCRGRVMLHGTLLFDASLETLARALSPNPLKLSAKGIKSVKSRVTNIRPHLAADMSVTEFADGLSKHLTESEHCVRYELSDRDEDAVAQLAADKYDTFLWNFGGAPPYSVEKSAMTGGGLVTAAFDIKNDTISDIRIFGDFFGVKEISDVENILKKTPYEPTAVAGAISGINLDDYIFGASAAELVKLLF
ncbi:MAG: lipoate--protein ligase [Clostridiales bacterium]|jgi:lipoate-protein ligase A|nr:lipoate--protein ligase [Clostridiales bacterium]